MAATAQDGASSAASPDPGRPARRLGRRATVLVIVVAAATLAVTGYACALAGIDGVAAIRGMAGGHRPPPGKGVVSGISSFVGSSAFAAALNSASAAPAAGGTPAPAAGGTPAPALTARRRQECLPATAACVDLTGRVPGPPPRG
jgi:hypothetical protein